MGETWQERANRRRDARQTRVPDVRPPSGSRKNTKRWCRGKVGVEHKPICADYGALKHTDCFKGWKVLICSECKRDLDHWWPSPWLKQQRERPGWVK